LRSATVDTLMKWIEEWLEKVREMIGSWGEVTESDTVCVLWFLYNAPEPLRLVIPLAEPLILVVGACIRFAQSESSLWVHHLLAGAILLLCNATMHLCTNHLFSC
jgi:hypothetical protein